MTPAQKQVARHMLGLPTGSKRSWRNAASHMDGTLHRLVAEELVAAGKAVVTSTMGAEKNFRLTPEGAAEALELGETLSQNDFPPEGVIFGGHPSNMF